MDIIGAIEKLKNEKEAIDEHGGYYGMSEHIDLAIEALEKQIPKNPIIESWNPALCPSCGEELSESIGDGYYKHWQGLKICECGQKLKWDNIK